MKKKFKIILLVITILLMILFLFATCKKTKALESVFIGNSYSISSNNQSDYNFVAVYYFGQNASYSNEFFQINDHSGNTVYLITRYNNILRILRYPSGNHDEYTISSNLIQVQLVEDTPNNLYLIIYQISFSLQRSPGLSPAVDGISRTMLTRYNLDTEYNLSLEWSLNYVNIVPLDRASYWTTNCLLNCSYISYSDTPQDINTWVDSQIDSYLTLNNLIQIGYNYGVSDGYDSGYNYGVSDGEEIGYDNGYEDGETVGYNNGYSAGLSYGFDLGYDSGYNNGYVDGENGENAVSKAVNVIGSIFGAIGTVLSIELFPGIPMGLFFLVPLFFAVIGLILWIWRRN